jgi:hypothetical protein
MKKDEWKKILEAWEHSKKRKEFKDKLYAMSFRMSNEQVINMLNVMDDYHSLSDDEKTLMDLNDGLDSAESYIEAFMQQTLKLSFFETRAVEEQNFELAMRLRDSIKKEAKLIQTNIEQYFPHYEIQPNTFEFIIKYAFYEVQEKYNYWKELIKIKK